MIVDNAGWLTAMAIMIAFSAFFSASEAALFYLRWQDRRWLRQGNRWQRLADSLLNDPDRVLSAVLFWNLAINMAYFAIASIVGLNIERSGAASGSFAVGFAVLSLLTIIFLSEMLPKSLAVLSARRVAGWVSPPLALAIRCVDPIMPVLGMVNLVSQRLLAPNFQTEPYLDVGDLERAIELSTKDAQLVEQERAALQNIIQLSETRADEWMRPRTQFLTFRPPVSLRRLEGRMTPSGYLLVTEPHSEEVAGAIALKNLWDVPAENLEHHAVPVVYVPWCTTVADVLQVMRQHDRQVAAVVNEFGETIGILTFDDVLDTIFSHQTGRGGRMLDRKAIVPAGEGVWHVSGMTSLRRLARHFHVQVSSNKSVTVTGCIQEQLQRVVQQGDEVDWGPFHFRVLAAPLRGQLLVELSFPERGVESE